MTLRGLSYTEEERAFLQQRVALFWKVIVLIALSAGFLLARRLTRPIPVAVRAARAVADGERELDLPDLRNDEFGDLGRRLIRTADTLSRQERALEAEFERKRGELALGLTSTLTIA